MKETRIAFAFAIVMLFVAACSNNTSNNSSPIMNSAKSAAPNAAPTASSTQEESAASNTNRSAEAKTPILNEITVPISVAELTRKIGQRQSRISEEPWGDEYRWNLQDGLEVAAIFGGDEEQQKKIFGTVFISATQFTKEIPNCPFGFVLNKTTLSEVQSTFGGKLKKHGDSNDQYKVYFSNRWNHFKFRRQVLIEITLSTVDMETVS